MVTNEKMSIENIINDYNSKILSYPIHELPNGFVQGKLGVLYYLMYVYIDTQKVIYFDKITDILMDVFNTIQNPEENALLNDSSFAEGISGLGFVISELINNDLLDEEYAEQIPVLSEIAFDYASKKLEQNNYDFLHGSIGVLKFLLKVENQNLFNQLVNQLLKKSKESVLLFSTQSDDPYISDINFGFPHGYLSIIKLLLDAKITFGAHKTYYSVIDLCVSKIMKHIDKKYEVDGIHIYKPHKVYINNGKLIEHQNNRLAWCNSDLSWVFLLSKIDSVNNTSNYNQMIDEIGSHLIKRREMHVTGVQNHHFCHGSSGIAQLFGELYEYTKDKKYNEAYNYWTQRTVNYLKEDLFNDLTERDMSLYYGKIGALLTLYSYQKEFPQGWKEAFLIN
ncbi:lanthionine synthetase LanC family protein [Tenacibaculum sp. MEBiC06402]|uniref:lanthionine synthetase LanC family protein n=1 Tax=unclassified Tenacibaculum TaxID=2635139 RepID=UPI003B9D1795